MEWYGELPVSWEERTLKNLFQIRKVIAGEEGYKVLSITQKGIRVKDITLNEGQMAQSYAKYQFVNIGDFAMNHMDLLTGWVDYSDVFGVTSPDYRVFTLTDTDQNKDFLLKILQLCYSQRIFYALGRGAASEGRWRLPAKEFLNFVVPIPPKRVQDQIVRYLDDKLAMIDRLIEAKKKQINLLQEHRNGVISNYLSQIHSKKRPLKQVATIKNGKDYKHLVLEEGGYPVMGSGGEFARASQYLYDKPSVLFGRKGTVDKPLYTDFPFWSVDTMFYTEVSSDMDAKFLWYVATQIDYDYYSTQTAVPSMTQRDLGSEMVPVPSIEVQKELGRVPTIKN